MKILFITNQVFDGTLSMGKSLKDKVDLYCLLSVNTSVPNRFEINKSFESDIVLATEIEEMNLFKDNLSLEKTFILNGNKISNIFFLLRQSIKIYKLVKKINPDIIHCYHEQISPNFLLCLLLTKKPIVLTVHDPIPHSSEHQFKRLFKRKYTFAVIRNNYILLNKNQKEAFINKYHKKNKNIYISALSIYDYLVKYQIEKNKEKSNIFNVLFFGRITRYKGIEYLLEAFEKLQSEGVKNISFTIAGGYGDFYFDVEKYSKNQDITLINRVVSNEELVQLINDSSIVVCPYTDATQSGVIMSIFAFNKPVIATNVGGLGEMVDDGKTGILIPPRDVEAIKQAIKQVYENRDLLTQMSQNISNEWQTGKRSWNAIADGLVEIYKDVKNYYEHSINNSRRSRATCSTGNTQAIYRNCR